LSEGKGGEGGLGGLFFELAGGPGKRREERELVTIIPPPHKRKGIDCGPIAAGSE